LVFKVLRQFLFCRHLLLQLFLQPPVIKVGRYGCHRSAEDTATRFQKIAMSERNSTAAGQPSKPSPDFPLFPHATERWAKNIRGKMHYLGTRDNPDAVLDSYTKQKDALPAGRERGVQVEGTTRKELVNAFLNQKKPLCRAASYWPAPGTITSLPATSSSADSGRLGWLMTFDRMTLPSGGILGRSVGPLLPLVPSFSGYAASSDSLLIPGSSRHLSATVRISIGLPLMGRSLRHLPQAHGFIGAAG